MSNFHKRQLKNDNGWQHHKIHDIKPIKIKKKSRFFKFRWPNFKRKKLRNSSLAKRLARRLWPYALGVFFIGGIFFVGLVAWYSKDLPDPNKIMDRSVPLSTKIFDRTGEVLLYEIHGPEKRTLITLDQIPQYAIDATIAIEDKNFYEHGGISVWGILRGQIMPRLQGKRAQGGSTLTQQFVKNAILTNERALSRKIKEWILSFRLEQKFSKEEILQLYFNEIPYGSSAYGIESAAGYYFDKPAKDLTLAESAILAALPQAPSYFSPYGNNKEGLIARQHVILDLMTKQGLITDLEAENAKSEELQFKKRQENIKAPHFVMYIRQLLAEEYGEAVIEQSGWKIITTLDWELQQKAEEIIDELAESNQERFNASNAGLVALNVENSEILAMIGSRDYFNDEIDGQVNVTLAERQPGSSLKPLVYLTAFEQGYRPDTMLFDLTTNFASAGDDYRPLNYDLEERGPVTIRQALAGSLNIPAVKTLYLAGLDNVVKLAKDFGYTTLGDRDRYGLSLVLGGGEVKLLEHVNAYASFAREGVYKDSLPILAIEDSEGKEIEDNKDNKGRRILDKDKVRLLNDILSDNAARSYVFGESNYLTLPDRPVAAKTGTTNDYRDSWTIGFTPQIALGVWAGNNDNSAMSNGASGSQVAGPIWNKVMRELTKNLPVAGFAKTELNSCRKPMVCGELSDEEIIKIDKMSGLLATEYTPYTQIEERKYLQVHNILQYVNRNDPLGAPLDDPSHDSQYGLWEEPVQAWADEQGYLTEEPPTEYDDIHLAHLRPSVDISYPSNNQTVKNNTFTLQVNSSAPLGVGRVEYFIDGQKVGQSTNSPFSFNYQVNPLLSNGKHQLKAMAFDGLENWQEDIIEFNLQSDRSSDEFSLLWLAPDNGMNIAQADLPYTAHLKITNPDKIKKIDFYYLDPSDHSHWFAFIEHPGEDIITNWGNSDYEPGVYKLYLMIKDINDRFISSPPIVVNIQ
ncbi:penicillin-binding protein [bacterium]|jgi:1A family penicillin-binding protein|nr:penicillin-binding protein [bacterium]MBT4649072.1 penicillin-binding protein [bacterium]